MDFWKTKNSKKRGRATSKLLNGEMQKLLDRALCLKATWKIQSAVNQNGYGAVEHEACARSSDAFLEVIALK